MLVVFSDKHDLSDYDYVPVDVLRDYPLIMTYQSYDRDVRKVFDQAGAYDSRMLDPESYRTLGIGIKSIKEAGPLARSVISYLKENVR